MGTALQSQPCSPARRAHPWTGTGTQLSPLCHLTLTRAGAAGIFSQCQDAVVLLEHPEMVM